MNKPLFGIPLRLFQLWLYAPLLILFLVTYQTQYAVQKVGWLPTLISLGASLLIAGIVIFSKEFRQFSRVTPRRILIFFAVVFAVTEYFVLLLAFVGGDFRFTSDLITYPGFFGLVLTPAMAVRLDFLKPRLDENSV
jgi:hypothetical protein